MPHGVFYAQYDCASIVHGAQPVNSDSDVKIPSGAEQKIKLEPLVQVLPRLCRDAVCGHAAGMGFSGLMFQAYGSMRLKVLSRIQ
jgi:hypothetical protein